MTLAERGQRTKRERSPGEATTLPQSIFAVPLVDVNWEAFAPLDAERGFAHGPVPEELCLEDVEACTALMRGLVDGRFAYAVPTGTYAREVFCREPFLELYRQAVADGAEIVAHPHEELAGVGARYDQPDHMRTVITDLVATLRAAGLEPIGYRNGVHAYLSYYTPLLEELGLRIDLSARPAFSLPLASADWVGAPFSGYYLDRVDYRRGDGTALSRVFEIPLGADGVGSTGRNYLYVEEADDADLRRVWDAILRRSEQEGRPQFVHLLFHTSSMHRPGLPERLASFVAYAREHQGYWLTPSACRDQWHASQPVSEGGGTLV